MRRLKPILDEIATVEKDIYQDYIGKTLLNPDKILKRESGGKSVEIYEDLLQDAKVGSAMQTRALAVVGKEWEIIPASEKREDQRIAEYVRNVLIGFDFDGPRMALLTGLVIGFKPAEIMWEYSEGDIYVREITGRASRRFVFDKSRNLRLLTRSNMVSGEAIPDRKFIVYTRTSANGSPYGDGLGRMLYWPVWFKKNTIKFWMVFADKFGSPTVIGKYPPGTDKAQQDALLDAIDAVQQEAAIKIPDGMVVELLEATRTGSIATYDALVSYMDAAIAQVILGQTLTSDIGDKGSYAASQTHESVRQDYLKADADSLCLCLNETLIPWIVDYNFPRDTRGKPRYPKIWIRTSVETDLKPLAERDSILVGQIGLPVSKKYFYDTYGIPEPRDGEETVEPNGFRAGNAAGTAPLSGAGEEFAEQTEGKSTPAPPDLIAAQRDIDALADAARGAGGIDLSALDRVVADAQSYDDLQQRIASAYQDVSIEQFREILAKAMFLADIRGRMLS